jgi:hypothetical protein
VYEERWDSTPEQKERVDRAKEATSAAGDRAYNAWLNSEDDEGPRLTDMIEDAQRAALMPYLRGEVV